MLVVIAIIGILASMLMPSLMSALESAKTASCINRLKQLGTAYVMYSDENNGYGEFTGSNFVWREKVHGVIGSTPSGIPTWIKHGSLYATGYIDSGELFYCPTITLDGFTYDTAWNDTPVSNMMSGYVPRFIEGEQGSVLFYTGGQSRYAIRLSNIQSNNDNRPAVLLYDYTKNEHDSNSSPHDPDSPRISEHPGNAANMIFNDLHTSTDNTGFYSELFCLPFRHHTVCWDKNY